MTEGLVYKEDEVKYLTTNVLASSDAGASVKVLASGHGLLANIEYSIDGVVVTNAINAGTYQAIIKSIDILGNNGSVLSNYEVSFSSDTYTLVIEKAKAKDVDSPAQMGSNTYSPTLTLADVEITSGWIWHSSVSTKLNATTPTRVNEFETSFDVSDLDNNYEYKDIEGYDSNSHKIIRKLVIVVNKATLVEGTDFVAPQGKTGLVYKPGKQNLLISTLTSDIKTLSVMFKLDEGEFVTDYPKAINADTYEIYYKLTDSDENYDIYINETPIVVTIDKQVVEDIVLDNQYFTNRDQKALITSNDIFNVTINNSYKNVGNYFVTLVLVDPNNYKWSDRDGSEKDFDWSIVKTTTEISFDRESLEIVYGEIPDFNVYTNIYGINAEIYSINDDTSKTNISSITNAGTYEILYVVNGDGENYTNASEVFTIKVNFKAYTPGVDFVIPSANTLTFNNSNQELVAGFESAIEGIMIQYKIGIDGALSTEIPTGFMATTYNVYYVVSAPNHIDYESVDAIVVTIEQLELTTDAKVSLVELTYNGSEQSELLSSLTQNDVTITLDNYELSNNVETNVNTNGTYTLIIKGINNVKGTIEVSWNIKALNIEEATITLAQTPTYTGSELTQEITSVILNDLVVTYEVVANSNKATNVSNTGYELVITGTGNFEGSVKALWNINKAQVEKPELKHISFVYDGTEQTAKLAESKFYTLTNNKATNPGNYTANVVLNDKNNYEWKDSTTTDLSLSFTIKAKEIAKEDIVVDPTLPSNPDKPIIDISSSTGIEPTIKVEVSNVDTPKVENQLRDDELINSTVKVEFDNNGVKVEPEGNVEIKLLIPEELKDENFMILDENGTKVDYEIIDGYAVFNSGKLGEFSSVTRKANNAWAIAGLVLLSALLVSTITANVLIFTKKKKEDKEVAA